MLVLYSNDVFIKRRRRQMREIKEEIECKMLFTPPIVDINNSSVFCREITCLKKAVVYVGVVVVGYNKYTFILPLCKKHYNEYSSHS